MLRIAFGLLLSTVVGAHAATFKSVATKEGRTIVLLSGEITEGDAEALKIHIKAANDAGKLVSGVRLNSPGGLLLEGIKLADVVRYAKIATNVAGQAKCASACFLVFAAGATKFANYTAQVGVHGASDKTGEETLASGAATVSMARAAKELGVPPAIIGRMVVTPPTEMVWLTPQDLQTMGATMVGKPSQVAISPTATANADPSSLPQQTRIGEPIELQPKRKEQMSWNDMLAGALKLSARQNGGAPKVIRNCQPSARLCANAVMFKLDDGQDGVMLTREDLNGKVVEREICTFNSFGDIRTCTDWDTKTSHRDMKDPKGEWTKVADE